MREIQYTPLSEQTLAYIDAYWRAANYLAVGQIYLLANPLLREPLRPEHIKPRLLGHWGTVPGLTFTYAHLNRVIKVHDLEMVYVVGPGHGGAAAQAVTWLDGTLSEVYPSVPQDAGGMARLFKGFSFPGGMPSHAGPEVPGSLHEGGELGYSLAHAYGAVFDNPELVAACVVADGEAETGALATAWHSNKFLDPARDGAVLPILHLNDYKIGNPTILSRISDDELTSLLVGYGYDPYLVTADSFPDAHHAMAATLDHAVQEINSIQRTARHEGTSQRPRWPLIVLRSPKGWTGPEHIDGVPVEGTWRSHQIPLPEPRENPEQRDILVGWMKSYRPEELFDDGGRPQPVVMECLPRRERRMSANPHANGGSLVRDLRLPGLRDHAVPVTGPGRDSDSPAGVLGGYLREVLRNSARDRNFRLFCPDEIESNHLGAVYETANRAWNANLSGVDTNLASDGRIMEVLSEHTLQGWLEGYILTGRHGLFVSYEAFIHIIDSMFNQHAKWLKIARELDWREPVPSLNYLLSSHVWQQDHNGFSHQDPGFLDHVANKKPDIVRIYLPPDANCLLTLVDRCLRTKDQVNAIVAGKHAVPNWLDIDQAQIHCAKGVDSWPWASNDRGAPDVVMACAGDVPTRETLAAVDLLRHWVPDLKIRVVNVVDLMRLQPDTVYPHGLTNEEFDALFTTSQPVIFAYHGYPWLIHRLTHRRVNHENLHVHGYTEEGATTTPFDMLVRNGLDRFTLAMDAIGRLPQLGPTVTGVKQVMRDKLAAHHAHIREHGEDLPEIPEWRWART